MLHPEAGHILMTPREDDPLTGVCPYHRGCLEGLASGPAMEKRWGQRAETLYHRPEVWELEAYYLALAITQYILILSPEKIIIGGGVIHQEGLLPIIREKVTAMLGGYINTPALSQMEEYLVLPSLKDNQGIMGALKLGILA